MRPVVAFKLWLMLTTWLLSQEPAKVPDRPAKSGATITVRGNAEFAAAVTDAAPGTTILLDSAIRFAGLVIPDGKSGLTIRPTGDTVVIESVAATQPALAVGLRVSDVTLQGLTLQGTNPGTTQILYVLCRIGYDAAGRREAATVDELPQRIELDNCQLLGTPGGNTRIGLLGNARHLTVTRCKFREIHEVGADSQGILVTNTPGPVLIADCDIEAAGENIMLGGSIATIPGLQIADLTCRGNRLAKPLAWKGTQPAWQIKNLLELKGCVRATITGNRLENCWEAAQNGTAILLTPRDRSRVGDVLLSGNTISNVGAGIAISAADDLAVVDKVTGPVVLRDNLWLGVGDQPGAGRVYNFSSPDGRPTSAITIERDRWFHGANAGSVAFFEGKAPAVSVLTMRDCTGTAGRYGILGTGTGTGTASLTAWTGRTELAGVVLINGSGTYPAGVVFTKAGN